MGCNPGNTSPYPESSISRISCYRSLILIDRRVERASDFGYSVDVEKIATLETIVFFQISQYEARIVAIISTECHVPRVSTHIYLMAFRKY